MDDAHILAMRDISAAYDQARRLAVNLWTTHYKSQSPDWKLVPDFLGVILQISNMTAGLVKPENRTYPPPRSFRQHYANTHYREIVDKIGFPPDFRERMETFFRRHDMDDKRHMDDREYFSENAAGAKQARQQLQGGPLSALAGGFTDEQLTLDPVLRYFHYAHLPPMLQPTSAIFCRAARYVVEALPRNAERTVALRKLLEAKDAAVRANVEFTHPAPGKEETFLDRLHKEYGELNERKAKLWAFIASLGFLDLPAAEQKRLRDQHTVMDQYAQILIERISCAEDIRKQRDGQASTTETFEQAYERAQSKGYATRNTQSEQIDENVRITGGGKSEEPLPFSD